MNAPTASATRRWFGDLGKQSADVVAAADELVARGFIIDAITITAHGRPRIEVRRNLACNEVVDAVWRRIRPRGERHEYTWCCLIAGCTVEWTTFEASPRDGWHARGVAA